MEHIAPPTLGDEDVDVLIEWLSQKNRINKQAINLVVQTLTGLKEDRATLVRQVLKLEKADV